jgi:hypothetical protein
MMFFGSDAKGATLKKKARRSSKGLLMAGFYVTSVVYSFATYGLNPLGGLIALQGIFSTKMSGGWEAIKLLFGSGWRRRKTVRESQFWIDRKRDLQEAFAEVYRNQKEGKTQGLEELSMNQIKYAGRSEACLSEDELQRVERILGDGSWAFGIPFNAKLINERGECVDLSLRRGIESKASPNCGNGSTGLPGAEGTHTGQESSQPGCEGTHTGQEPGQPGAEGTHTGLEALQPGAEGTHTAQEFAGSEQTRLESLNTPVRPKLKYQTHFPSFELNLE